MTGTAWALDLDGVIWRGGQPIPRSADAVARLRAAGRRVVFLTNNSYALVADQAAKLASFGIPVDEADVLTSAQAAAAMVEPGSTALLCGGPGARQALEARGVTVVRDGRADAVVVGFDPAFDFGRLTAAFKAIRTGARFIGTNDDATYPTPDGEIPGGGSLVAAVAYATGLTPEIAGKPHAGAAALLHAAVGDVDIVVGDRPSTDGMMAVAAGARFGLVLSGVTTAAEAERGVAPTPALVAADLWSLVELDLGEG